MVEGKTTVVNARCACTPSGPSSPWAEVREVQVLTSQAVPNTGMAVAIDPGDTQDIHPKNKQPVALPLSLAAGAM